MDKSRLAKTFSILVLVGLVFGVAIIFLMKFVDGPVSGNVGSTTLAEAKASVVPTPQPPHQLAGLYVALDYPATYDELAQIKTDKTALEQYDMSPRGDYRQSITVHVADLPSGDPHDDASYRIREMNTSDYRSSIIPGIDRTVLMTKADGSEQTLFVVHKAKLLTVSVTSTSMNATAKDIMAIIQPSVRWIQ
jgi:hypothetical protein